VAEDHIPGAFLGRRWVISIDGFRWDAPDTAENSAAFGYVSIAPLTGPTGVPKAQIVSISECGSRAVADAEIGGVAGKGVGKQALARKLYLRLRQDWLLIADRNLCAIRRLAVSPV
jgi:hypothetical protein